MLRVSMIRRPVDVFILTVVFGKIRPWSWFKENGLACLGAAFMLLIFCMNAFPTLFK